MLDKLRPWLIVASITGATVLPSYLNGALTVALPSIGADLGLNAAELQWPLTVLTLTNGAFLLVSGGLADAFGRRHMFLVGTAWLLLVSLVLGFVKQASTFIALSALLGLGPALLTPSGTGILGESLPNGKIKNAAFACLGAGQPLGFIIGLLFGGIFGHRVSIIYWINAGAAAVFGVAAWTCLPQDGEKVFVTTATSSDAALLDQDRGSPRRALPIIAFDWTGAALSTSGIILLTLGVAFAGTERKGWASVPTLVMLPTSLVLLATFFAWELHVQRQSSSFEQGQSGQERSLKAPLIPPGVWRAPRFTATLVTVFLAWLSFNALTYFCTLFFQEVQHNAPLQTSVRFLPMIGAGFLLNIVGGVAVGRVDGLWLVFFGSMGGLASALLFCFVGPDWSYARGMLPVLILVVSPDVFFPAAQLFACHTVGPRRAALAGSLFNVSVRLATSIGIAAASTLASAISQHSAQHNLLASKEETLLAGYRAAGILCAVCSGSAMIVSAVFLRKMGVVGKLGMRAVPETSSPPDIDRDGNETGATSAATSMWNVEVFPADLAEHNGVASEVALPEGDSIPMQKMAR